MSLYGHLFFIDFKQDLPHFKYNPEYTGVHDIYIQMEADEEDECALTEDEVETLGLALELEGRAAGADMPVMADEQDQSDSILVGCFPENVVEAGIEPDELAYEIDNPTDETMEVSESAPTDVHNAEVTEPDRIDSSDFITLMGSLDISEILGDEVEEDKAPKGLVPVPPPEVNAVESHDFITRIESKTVVGKLLGENANKVAADIDSIIKDLEEPGECLYCGGSGRTRESENFCPHCNRKPIDGSLDRNVDILQLMGIYIPAFFRTEEGKFDVDKILAKYKDESVVALSRASLWLRNLGIILDKIRNKDFKGGQTILGVHASMDNIMYQWMYAGITAALETGFSTSAILNPITIDIYNFPDMFRDVLFFELVSLDYAESFRKLEYICKQRAHHDKPTFIVTNVHLKDLDSIYPVSSRAGVFQAITSYTYSQEYRLASSVGVRNR